MGLEEGGLNFGAEITLNYDSTYQSKPMIGMFVIIELERPDEAVLGRICAISSHGRLASVAGEDLGVRIVNEKRPMPEDIKEQFLRYKCSIRLLGLLRESNNKILFTPSQRRLPHLGAKVAFADDKVLQAVAGAYRSGEPIGFLAFGEFIYAQGHPYANSFPENFQLLSPVVEPRFDAGSMVARRTAVLARSGYGKSNLLKILFARLYQNPPTLNINRDKVPVGTLVFDPDGDYFWPGAGPSSPPGLCDISDLVDQIVLATDRKHQFPYYDSFRVTSPKPDLRTLSPKLVLNCYLTRDRMNQRGTEALMRMKDSDWATLVDTAWLDYQGNRGILSKDLIKKLCPISGNNWESSAYSIRNTMLDLVAKLHNPHSTLIQAVERGLSDGKLVIVDLSLMRGKPATSLTAMLLRYIFESNVEKHTEVNSRTIPVIALIEEAQKVLEGSNESHEPFIEWVKEGRKYNLGAVMVTQQPGAIDQEILSQTDNFFVFHLISGSDLTALNKANGHFSQDILATLLHEPIEGQGVFWSSTGEKTTYPIPFRAYNFGDLYERLPKHVLDKVPSSYAVSLKSNLKPGGSPSHEQILQLASRNRLRFPTGSEITEEHRKIAKHLRQADFANWNNFGLYRVVNWLIDNNYRRQDNEQYAVEIVTALFGLHGYGWELIKKVSQNGYTYRAVKKLDPKRGLDLLYKDEQPKLPEDQIDDD